MPIVDAKCTNCGATLQVDDSKEAMVCQYCGNAFIVEKAIKNYQFTKPNTESHSSNAKTSSATTSANNAQTSSGGKVFAVIVIIIVLVILAIYGLNHSGTGSGGKSGYTNITCDWCGKEEECKAYNGQSIGGYNRDGSIKYKYETLWLSDKCKSKAERSTEWVGIYPMK